MIIQKISLIPNMVKIRLKIKIKEASLREIRIKAKIGKIHIKVLIWLLI